MVDGHIHIEKGAYTIEWISQFVNKGLERGLDEIWLLEHCYRFRGTGCRRKSASPTSR